MKVGRVSRLLPKIPASYSFLPNPFPWLQMSLSGTMVYWGGNGLIQILRVIPYGYWSGTFIL